MQWHCWYEICIRSRLYAVKFIIANLCDLLVSYELKAEENSHSPLSLYNQFKTTPFWELFHISLCSLSTNFVQKWKTNLSNHNHSWQLNQKTTGHISYDLKTILTTLARISKDIEMTVFHCCFTGVGEHSNHQTELTWEESALNFPCSRFPKTVCKERWSFHLCKLCAALA